MSLDPDHDALSSASAATIRMVANVLGVLAGILFLIAFALGVVRQGEWRFLFLGLGLLFLLFPVLMNRIARPQS